MKRFFYSAIGALATGIFPAAVLAQTNTATTTLKPSGYFDPSGSIQRGSGLPTTSISDYIFNIINAILGVLAVVALILILYGGFTIMTSAGNEDKISTGRQTLIWAFVGLLIIFSSFSILLLFDQII